MTRLPPLSQQTILITGASRGIGRSLALSLAAEGAQLALTARDEMKLKKLCDRITADGGSARYFAADVTDASRANSIVWAIEKEFGAIHALINNAGVSGDLIPFWEDDIESIWRTIEINLRGVMAYTHAVLPGMMREHAGTIINLGSYAGVRPTGMVVPYATSKAAVARFTDSLNASLDDDSGINLFTVSPGVVDTDMTRNHKLAEIFKDLEFQDIGAIGALIRRLLTEDVSALSGRFIHVTDDLDELLAHAHEIAEAGTYVLRLPKLNGLA